MKFIKYCFVFLTCLLSLGASGDALADDEKPTIAVIAKHFQGRYSHLAMALSLSNLQNDYQFVNSSLEDWLENPRQASFIVTLGAEALEALNQSETKQPILATLITSAQWYSLSETQELKTNISAIFFDPDIKRQLALGKMLIPQAKSVGILIDSKTSSENLRKFSTSEQLGLELNFLKVDNNRAVSEKYAKLADKTDFQLALPNSRVYNRVTIPKILLTSYRQNKPVIGYSIGMVKAGAIATTYTDGTMLVSDLAESASQLFSKKIKTFHRHSTNFSIKYNQEVANTLSITMVSLEQLLKQLKQSAEQNKIRAI